MKLLFFNTASRVYHDKDGNLYLNPHITNQGFRQYLKYCDEFILLLRDGGMIDNTQCFEPFDCSIGKLIIYPDVYKLSVYLNPIKRFIIKRKVKQAIDNADRVICGSQGGYMVDLVTHYCKKRHKVFMIYCLGMMFESLWHHSIKGKLVAFAREHSCKRIFKNAPYALYVTQYACQKRYPCNGQTLGCSDVEIEKADAQVLQNRISKIYGEKGIITIGTAAYLDVKWKGQYLMLHALSVLKAKGYNNIQYQMIGLGTGDKIRKLAKKLDIEDNIRIIGAVPHDQIFKWLDSIDIYVQPSFQEGLCRSIVEAMSRGCPVICSNVGGNDELIESDFIFPVGNIKSLTGKIIKLMNGAVQEQQSIRNFNKAKEYQADILESKRSAFIQRFIDNR